MQEVPEPHRIRLERGWFSPQKGRPGPTRDGSNVCFIADRHPNGKWYNQLARCPDRLCRNAGGQWEWANSGLPMEPIWQCTQCQEPQVMVCECPYEDGAVPRRLRFEQHECIHKTADPYFLCRSCEIKDDTNK